MFSYSLHHSPEMNVMFVPFNGIYLSNKDCYYYIIIIIIITIITIIIIIAIIIVIINNI